MNVILHTNPSARAGYDARSLFKRGLTGLKIAGGRIIGFIPFPMILVLSEMQSFSSRIWTRVAVSISTDDNHYTTGTSKVNVIAWLEFEFAYYDSVVYHFNHYSTRTPRYLVIVNKKTEIDRTCRIVSFAIQPDLRVNFKEREKNDKYKNFAREIIKVVEHVRNGDTNYNWCTRNVTQRLNKGERRVGNRKTTVKDHQLTLTWKTSKEY